MHNVSDTYRAIRASGDYIVETQVAIGTGGMLIDENKNYITFGGTRIKLSDGDEVPGFGDNMLLTVKTTRSVFAKGTPGVGGCVCGELDLEMFVPKGDIERKAKIVPKVRLKAGDGTVSEWLKKGIYFIDTRQNSNNNDNLAVLTLHAYDAMMMAEQSFPDVSTGWDSKTDIEVVRIIATAMDVSISANTTAAMTRRYIVQYPGEYSMREVLGYIAAMYGGNFVMNDDGELDLIQLNRIPGGT